MGEKLKKIMMYTVNLGLHFLLFNERQNMLVSWEGVGGQLLLRQHLFPSYTSRPSNEKKYFVVMVHM